MKKLISIFLVIVMMMSCFNGVLALDGEYGIAADKTAQWTMQQKSTGYDLRVHGWSEWETAAYIGFTLPENFTSDNLVSAKLVLYTVSANKEGTAYLYSADYSAFENNAQHEGTSDVPTYNTEQILSFTSPTQEGEFEIDIADYISTLEDNADNLAFRIDVKSQNTNNKWIIGSCNNGYQAPKLVLEYDDPSIIKSDITVNAVYGDKILASFTDRVAGQEKYTLTNEQVRYIRQNSDIYYFPYDDATEYDINTDDNGTIINVPFEKISDDNLVFFEDFSANSLSDLSGRGLSASSGAEINNRGLKFTVEGTLALPEVIAGSSYSVSFDFTADTESTFTFKDENNNICSFSYNADTEHHNAIVTIENGTVVVAIDDTEVSDTETTASIVKLIAINGSAVIDNLKISVKEPMYGLVKNNEFSYSEDGWTVSENTYVTDDITDTFMVMKQKSAISQTVENIPPGKYDILARVKSDSMANMAYVYAKAEGHPVMKTSVSVTTYIDDNAWRDIYIRGVNIDNGTCEIGVVLDELTAEEVRVYPHIPDEPLPDGKGSVEIKSIELVSAEESNDTFLVGGDVNFLTFLEDKGVQYFDENGVEKDALQVMAENGANIVRLRLYNDPGKGHGDGVDYLPAGYQNPDDILDIARRAKEKGMQIQLTFHYSDYWTNAETQLIPHEWQEEIDKLSTQEEKVEKLQELLYNFTKNFMERMKIQGTIPEYVSFGNEMHTGLLFDDNQSYASANDFATLAEFLNLAYDAVKEVSPETKVILHLDGGGDKSKYNRFFNNCKTYGVNYDVIGTSYYPYWTQLDVATIVDFCSHLVNTFDKDIILMETGYSFVDKNKIGGEDTRFTNNGPYTDTFGMTKMGQKAFMEELYNGLKQTLNGRCLGDLYWDPIMVQHEGVGWAYKEADDSIEHNKNIAITLFDTDGYKLPAQKVFANNGYITDTVTISGKLSGLSDNNVVELNVNGKIYTTTPDRFGYYVQRVPYADTITVSAAEAEESAYTLDMTFTSVKREVNFTFDEPTATASPVPTITPTATPEPTITPEPTATPEPTPTPEPEGGLLENGSFENELLGAGSWTFPNAGGWYNESSTTADRTTAEMTDGSYAVIINNGTIAQRVTLEEGNLYTLTADIKADASGIVTYGFYDGTQSYPASNSIKETTIDPTTDWQKISLEFECNKTQDYVVCFKSWAGNNVYIDDVELLEPTDSISEIITDVAADGTVSYSVNYQTTTENPKLYVALYDENGNMIGCRVNEQQGKFEALSEYGKYNIKTFLWDKEMKPICKVKEEKVVYDEMGAYLFVNFTEEETTTQHEHDILVEKYRIGESE